MKRLRPPSNPGTTPGTTSDDKSSQSTPPPSAHAGRDSVRDSSRDPMRDSSRDLGPGAATRRHMLLAVDDEPSNLAVVERIFRTEYRVLLASNGNEALAQLRTHTGDDLVAILSDQRMPGMTGVELLAKAAEERPDVARVLVTGYSDMEAIISAINLAHVMHYVSKPFEPQTIRDVVARAVEEKQRRREHRERFDALRKRTEELEEALSRLNTATVSREK